MKLQSEKKAVIFSPLLCLQGCNRDGEQSSWAEYQVKLILSIATWKFGKTDKTMQDRNVGDNCSFFERVVLYSHEREKKNSRHF